MFDIGFLELLVIAVVGLLVVGPERLPDTVKTCARWVGRIKRVLRNAREEFEQQIGADEIRREIHNEEVLRRLQELKDTKQEIEQQFEPPFDIPPLTTMKRNSRLFTHRIILSTLRIITSTAIRQTKHDDRQDSSLLRLAGRPTIGSASY